MRSIYKKDDFNKKKSVDNYMFFKNSFNDEQIEKIFKIVNGEKFITGKTGEVVDKTYRQSNIKWIPFRKDTEWIYNKISNIVKSANKDMWDFDLIGFGEDIQFGEYKSDEQGHYDWHMDVGENVNYRKLSISVQLSDPSTYEGGDLIFRTGRNNKIAPKSKGTVIVFPSYLLHKVTPVTKGARYSMVVWITGPSFR